MKMRHGMKVPFISCLAVVCSAIFSPTSPCGAFVVNAFTSTITTTLPRHFSTSTSLPKSSAHFLIAHQQGCCVIATTRRQHDVISLAAHGGDVNIEDVPDIEMTQEELDFLTKTKTICEERNIKFDEIKNARDIASVNHSPAIGGRVLRLGRPSDASESDISILLNDLKLKTLVDLRSPTELKDDPTLERKELFKDFVSLVWIERNGPNGRVIEMKPGQPRIKKSVRKRDVVKGVVNGISSAFVNTFMHLATPNDDQISDQLSDELNESGLKVELSPEELCDCGVSERCDRKERHFVSLMNEFKYVKGTLSKLRKRDIAGVLLRSPSAIVSKRAREKVKDVFLDEINDGGLPMLNELLLQFGAPGIRYVLEICADKTRHPVGFYCTAGKDRTGMITALILSVLGVPDEDIVEDYSLSANVYAEMNDHKAMVGALSQRNLDPKTFLGAPPSVMRDTLAGVRETYGSVDGYLDYIGFGEESRKKLKEALLS
uniref:Tyrosine specific protein phosphatases domain-containing protein n=1 Tax=Ditylum brightwellii TaxID=49249 RepID=A0A6V2N8A0_9STRA|mmetsp:Transcript_8916/g.13192  ORF Transcript_8916/g.13192 Transcript_8916/m.13192 type:complete len:489 (-) Transcript_8916:186-1652(-)